jgi:hypothetical protein
LNFKNIIKRYDQKIRKKTNNNSNDSAADSLFALPSAEVSIETRLGVHSSGKAAVCLHDTDGIEFSNLIEDTKKFLDKSSSNSSNNSDATVEGSSSSSSLTYQVTKDAFGYIWIVLQSEKIEDLVAMLNAIGEDTTERGYQSQILAYVFEFSSESSGPDILYLIYNQKQGAFYPFVPLRNQTRNTDIELKVFALMKDELPMQKNFELWYPMWDMPLRKKIRTTTG